MDELVTVAFEAHHTELNRHRRYRITVGHDLLGDWTVTFYYGRIDQSGQAIRFGGTNVDVLRKIIREHLRRRLSAPTRIGCDYRLTSLLVTPGFDAAPWLPADLMARFALREV